MTNMYSFGYTTSHQSPIRPVLLLTRHLPLELCKGLLHSCWKFKATYCLCLNIYKIRPTVISTQISFSPKEPNYEFTSAENGELKVLIRTSIY